MLKFIIIFATNKNVKNMGREYMYKVNTRDIDFTRKASLTTISDYVIQAASEDADKLDAGIDHLNKMNLTWVLMRMAICMDHYPDHFEKFSIETWIESVDRLMVRRNMTIFNEKHEEIGHAITYWCVFSYESRTWVNLSEFPLFESYIEATPSKLKAPERIRDFEGEKASKTAVQYSHIDFNGHTNTTRYIDFILNSVSLDVFKESVPHRLDLNFVHESMYGDTIAIKTKEIEGGNTFSLVDDKTNEHICSAKITWRSRE